jgi:hypothetical protein
VVQIAAPIMQKLNVNWPSKMDASISDNLSQRINQKKTLTDAK